MERDRVWLKILLSLWQTLALGGILGGLIWATTRPNWILHDPSQVLIEGNHLLPRQVILSLLGLNYPKWLLQISPEEVASALESQAAIADVTVTRRLFPSGLVVQVEERVPVAIAITKSGDRSTPHPQAAVGFLDRDGAWIGLNSYPPQARQLLKSVNLKVIGLPEYYRSYWTPLYQAVSHSAVKVMEIDCQNPANLILKTEIGTVHLGSYSQNLTEQFKVLDRMRQLPTQLKASQINYIDLKNPATPLVQTYLKNNSETPSEQLQPTPKLVKPEPGVVKKDTN
jgi:cell division protein FtsQ